MATLLIAHEQYTFDDRLLAHVRNIVVQKLRRREPFMLSWSHTAIQGSGRYSIWITESSQLHFRFSGNDRVVLDRSWLEAMASAANAPSGLNLDIVPAPALDVADTP